MQPFEQLSRTDQRNRLRELGIVALQQYGLNTAQLTFLSDTENTIFRVDTLQQRYALRIHPLSQKSSAAILDELHWLTALRRDTTLPVPKPIATQNGELIADAELPGVPGSRQIVLFEWVAGEPLGDQITPSIVRKLGALMAQLHRHATTFTLPGETARDTTDWYGMRHWPLGELPQKTVLSTSDHVHCAGAAERAAAVIAQMSDSRDIGMIHSDVHFENCVDHHGQLRLIDFDDCQIAPFTYDLAIPLTYLDRRPDFAILRAALFDGYTQLRPLPQNAAREIEAFMVERGLRIIRRVASQPSVDYIPFGQQIIDSALQRCQRYLG